MRRNNTSRFERRCEEIKDEENKIPPEDEDFYGEADDSIEDAHCHSLLDAVALERGNVEHGILPSTYKKKVLFHFTALSNQPYDETVQGRAY
jgi:hypothetical protein